MRTSSAIFWLLLIVPLTARAGSIRIKERSFSDHEHLFVLGLSARTTVTLDGQKLVLDDPANPAALRLSDRLPRARYVTCVSLEHGRVVVTLDPGISAKTRVGRIGVAIDLVMHPRTDDIVHGMRDQAPISPPKPLSGSRQAHLPDRLSEIPAPFLATVEGAVDKVLSRSSSSERHEPPATDRTAAPGNTAVPAPSKPSEPTDLFRLPFPKGAGVAARRHGRDLLLIFDQERPVDTSMFARDHRIREVSAASSNGATDLRLRFEDAPSYELLCDDGGWSLRLQRGSSASTSISLRQEQDETLLFGVARPGRNVVVSDPDTGQLLLVGTTAMPGQGIDSDRRSALFSIAETDDGLIVAPSSDHLLLRPAAGGFALATDDGSPLHLPWGFTGERHLADRFRKTLELPSGSVAELSRRLRAAAVSAAVTPIRDRLGPRLSCIETLLSLGLGREAATLLAVALADAPAGAEDERMRLLRTIVGVLEPGSRSTDTASFPDSGASITDDSVFWNALAARPSDDISRRRDADRVRDNLNLYRAYPPLLARAVSRRVAETLLAGGSKADLEAVTTIPSHPGADLMKAIADDRLGQSVKALKELVDIERGPDRAQAAEATRREVEIRSRDETLAPSVAAGILATHRLDWRLAGEDGPLLLEEAEFRLKARQVARGLALLRLAGQTDPALRGKVSEATGEAIGRLADPRNADVIPDASPVSLSDQYADLIRSNPVLAAKIATIRAEKLVRLGLPQRAAESIEGVLSDEKPGSDRAALELRAAELRLQQGDAEASARLLQAADADAVPPTLAARRALVAAHLLARAGHPQEAVAALRDRTDPATLDARADFLADTGDWKGSESALAPLVAALPAAGPLSAHDEDLVLRFATAAFRAGDKGVLRELDHRQAARLSDAGDRVALARFARFDVALRPGLTGADVAADTGPK